MAKLPFRIVSMNRANSSVVSAERLQLALNPTSKTMPETRKAFEHFSETLRSAGKSVFGKTKNETKGY